ncbi:MAG: GNAT family N-acetyltransferase [Chloroflexi bacterium]|nr:GNAT family N-acetyltransferase [Chloroflexota bacterium]
MSAANPVSIHEQRRLIRQLLDDSSPDDAPTAYYALFSDPTRATLFIETTDSGQAAGFVGRFQTGIDLFRPLVTLRCQDAGIAAGLLDEALTPGRPYLLFAKLNQLALVGGSLHINNERILLIYQLDPARFHPEINVLVTHNTAHDGTPRCKISSGEAEAVAGVNWQSPAFAEIYVHTDPSARHRGWGGNVAAAITQTVLDSGRIPIYLVENHNEPSRRLAEHLGFVDTGARQVFADATYQGHPGRQG